MLLIGLMRVFLPFALSILYKLWYRLMNNSVMCSVHDKKHPPLTIYTRIYFSAPWRPEVLPSTPFAKAVASLPEDLTEESPESQVYHAFKPKNAKSEKKKDKEKKDKKNKYQGGDVVLRKGRYYAGDGNSLEEILSTRGIDTVILVRCVNLPSPN